MRPILVSVDAERYRQDAKWGEQNHEPAIWLTILQEEVGETAKAVLEGQIIDYHKELIQVAAVACAAAECLERNTDKAFPSMVNLQLEKKANS